MRGVGGPEVGEIAWGKDGVRSCDPGGFCNVVVLV